MLEVEDVLAAGCGEFWFSVLFFPLFFFPSAGQSTLARVEVENGRWQLLASVGEVFP